MSRILYAGLGQPYVNKKFISFVENSGIKPDGVVVEAKLLYNYRVKKFDDFVKLKEQGLRILLDIEPISKVKFTTWRKYVATLFDMVRDLNIFDAVIEYVPEGDEAGEFRTWLLENAPAPVAIMYRKRNDVDIAVEGSGILVLKQDEFVDVKSMARIAKEHGVSETIWHHYSKPQKILRDINDPNIDTIIFTFWNGVLRSGITLYYKTNRLDYTNVREISKPEWERYVRMWEDQIQKAGLNLDSLLAQNKSTWDKAFLNIIVLETLRHKSKIKPEPRGNKIAAFGCYNCVLADRCPYYEEGQTYCPLLEERMKDFKITDDADALLDGLLLILIKEKYQRYLRSRIFEDLEGGALDKHTSRLEDSLTKLVDTYLRLKYPERFRVSGEEEEDEADAELTKILEMLEG